MKFELNVHNVVVVGGSSGIGFAIAKTLLWEGCHVCIVGRSAEKLNKAEGILDSENLSVLEWDVTKLDCIREKINEAAVLLGGYADGLVESQGVYLAHDSWKPWKESEDDWDNVWDTNLKSNIFLLREFVSYLHNSNIKGNIFCVNSIAGQNKTIEGSYPASKYALERMVHSHAKKVAQFGIVINGINPGVVATPMNPTKEAGEEYKNCGIGRILSADEIAKLSLFMMSKEASVCIGTILNADGGFYGAI